MKTIRRWWRHRLDRFYLKQRWHIMADVILITIALTVLLIFIASRFFGPVAVDTRPVPHVEREEVVIGDHALVIESEIAKKNIHSDQEFKVKIKASNTGTQALTNLDLSLLLTSNKFSFTRIKSLSPESNFEIVGRKIILDQLLAGETQEIELALVLKSLPGSPRLIGWQLSGLYKEAGADREIVFELPDLKLISALIVKTAAYYNSPQGDQLGSGPIPPQVEVPTNYWIFFNLQNIGNKLGDLEVSAKLAENVSLYDNKSLSVGDFSYDEKQRKVYWRIKNIDNVQNDYQIGFEVQFIPSINQLGLTPALLTDLSFKATDLFCNEKISGKLLSVDTNLNLDTINKGQGTVTK